MSKKPYTILFDANPLLGSPTGIGNYAARLINAMAEQYPTVNFVGYYYNFLGRKDPPKLVANNIRFTAIRHAPGPLVNALRRCHLALPIELLVPGRFDFVLYTNFLGYPSLRRIPRAHFIYDLTYVDVPQYGSRRNVQDLQRFMPGMVTKANLVVTISAFSKRRIIEEYGIPDERIITTFIPPRVVEVVDDNAVNATLDKFGITKKFLLSIGTLEPRKNLETLLDAYAALPSDTLRSHALVLAGKYDWQFESIKSKVEALQAEGYDIICTGYITNQERAALYRSARLYVMSSLYEGFGMPVIEALSYGLPCVVSDISVLHEVGGPMVGYFDPQNVQSMSHAINNALATERPDPQLLINYVHSLPDWQMVAKTVMEPINDMLDRAQ
jgi:glycosyltransferase involved in cell wall biosynthesis